MKLAHYETERQTFLFLFDNATLCNKSIDMLIYFIIV